MALMRASWGILQRDKKILALPLCSIISCALVSASFVLPWFVNGDWQPSTNVQSLSFWMPYIEKLQSWGLAITSGDHSSLESMKTNAPFFLGLLFLFYLGNYFVIAFFNSAMVAYVARRVAGETPTLGGSLHAVSGQLPAIFSWVLLTSTVGVVLSLLEERFSLIGRLVVGFLGLAWTLASTLVVPIMVVEKVDPITALQHSASLLKKTWGEDLISGFGFGAIFSILCFPGYLICILGIMVLDLGLFLSVGLAAAYLVFVALIQSALQSIFLASLYFYARRGAVPLGFTQEMLASSIRPR